MGKTLEEAYESLWEHVDCLAHHAGTNCDVHERAEAGVYDAARALALAAHTAVCLRCSSPGWDCADRRRIEELGKRGS